MEPLLIKGGLFHALRRRSVEILSRPCQHHPGALQEVFTWRALPAPFRFRTMALYSQSASR